MNVKERKVFSLKNFRGLDKENKSLMVNPSRASDGYNFIIDSGTLKTRPAFKFIDELPVILKAEEKLIEWYNYDSLIIYVTNLNLYVYDGNTLTSMFSPDKDFDGKRPIFREEKNALFIFGLNNVYVFANVSGDFYIYPINQKPANPYSFVNEEEEYNLFDGLPSPYVPTLFIGDNAFEDVNLLSNAQKYQVFAETSSFSDGNMNIYYLPTHYNENKHGSFSKEITFYKNQFDVQIEQKKCLPLYIGVYDESPTFEVKYGDIVNQTTPVEITDAFYPPKDFEYYMDGTTKVYIYNKLNLDKVSFFKLFISPLQQTVFEYCMWHIENQSSITDNYVILFKLKIKHNSIVRDQTTNFIIQNIEEEDEALIAVQIYKYDLNLFDIEQVDVLKNTTLFESGTPVYPNYPTPQPASDVTYEIAQGSELYSTYNDYLADIHSQFVQDANNYMMNKKDTCSNPAYTDKETCELNGGYWHYSHDDIVQIKRKYYVYIIDRYQTYVLASCAATFRISQETAMDRLYHFDFNAKRNAFEIRLANYFYDYRNEPSINVKVSFENNPDYEKISQCGIGVNFGSENRLFLAGNPQYPNIDRYNVSNDLLGDNIANQSYELSYFPSKNYRVVGGKGAINGYVVSSDDVLYITKEEYPNDNMLFIRERILDEKGILGYKEYKTSINRTPLNDRCIVRYGNDIVMLTKDGLFAIELSKNIQTDERHLKMRAGFINKDLKAKIAAKEAKDIFMLENNVYLYMFIGKDVYVADNRYVDINENNIFNDLSYEIVHWTLFSEYITGRTTETTLTIVEKEYNMFYEMKHHDYDDQIRIITNGISTHEPNNDGVMMFMVPSNYYNIFDDISKYGFIFKNAKRLLGVAPTDCTIGDGAVAILDAFKFRNIADGDTLYFKDVNGVFHPFEVQFNDERTIFYFDNNVLGERYNIYHDVSGKELFISSTLRVDINMEEYFMYFTLSPYKDYERDILSGLIDNESYEFPTASPYTFLLNNISIVNYRWVSSITDLGNNLMEKTMFRVNLYATRKEKENNVMLGYKTARRLKSLDDGETVVVTRPIDLANTFDFGNVDFNVFTLNTFNEFGTSLPMKENNFLYIQFLIVGVGQVEINSLELIFKNNRMLKSVG